MKLIIIKHPSFITSQSMPRFANMLTNGMKRRGHSVEEWSPSPFFFQIPAPTSFKKWLGYIDQYILFPVRIKRKIASLSRDTLFVFTDHALGPWIPLVADRPHVIHCHDFLAQQSAEGMIPENPTGWTGVKYQRFIRRGFQRGQNFISVSYKTQSDLHSFLKEKPRMSKVVYNGFNQQIEGIGVKEARGRIAEVTRINVSNGYLLHVGGNQWYKNRTGVIEIYNAWREKFTKKLPLIMIGAEPNDTLKQTYNSSPYKADIHFLTGMDDFFVRLAYAGASVFLFPSLAEGFGWPIAEAMAIGCPVITTGEAPMTEVAGNAASFISRRPATHDKTDSWVIEGAEAVEKTITLTSTELQERIKCGLLHVKKFDTNFALDAIEVAYKKVLRDQSKRVQG